jgi:hypothetical protein
MASFLAIGKEDRWLLIFIWWRGQDGMMARRMEAQNHFGPPGMRPVCSRVVEHAANRLRIFDSFYRAG